MEKHSYETYEFLATTNSDSDTNQFFVLQDDGTILTVNNEIQYITQVEDDKNNIVDGNLTDGSAVFDVSQQYYVHVEDNAPELITDQFTITNGESNVYANSYLIQPESNSATEQMETEICIDPLTLDAQQLQHLNVEAFNGDKKPNDFTEITLSDDQYQILEQKGWILLESNNRIFILNTLGLHDITTNDKLIQKLKNELHQNSDMVTKNEEIKIDTESSLVPMDSTGDDPPQQQSDVDELFIAKNIEMKEAARENVMFVDIDQLDEHIREPERPSDASDDSSEVPMSINRLLNNSDQTNCDSIKKCDSIKIKTKYTFADIPDKILLGKTANGKKLFAKVKKIKKNIVNKAKININESIIAKNESDDKLYGRVIEKKPFHSTGLDGVRFINLIQDSFRDMSKVSAKSVAAAKCVVTQLLRMPNIKDSIVGTNLVFTKIITFDSENGKEIGQPTMVTGTIKVQDGEDTFIPVPLMLHQLLEEAEEKPIITDAGTLSPEEKTAKGVIDLFHIHVSEVRFDDAVPQTCINLSKRRLALDVLNDARKRHPNPVYACGSCGALFKSEVLLQDHQNNKCLDVEDELTIDTDEMNNSIEALHTVIENGNGKLYACMLCETKFTRLFNCQKHIKAHKTGAENKLKIYKCKMCPNTYFHSSSLSKHIVKTHIQISTN